VIHAPRFNYIKKFFTSGDGRSLRAKKNVLVSFICKGLTIIISFLIVPLTFGYVGTTEFGIWLTIGSIIQWFGFLDIGLGNGLRNKLAETLAIGDKKTARVYISSVFVIISIIAALMFSGFFLAAHFISWNSALNTDSVPNAQLLRTVIMVFFFFCVGFIANITSSILQAMQKYALNDILALTGQLLGLAGLYILVKTTDGSLFNLCLVYGSKSAVVLFFATLVLFSTSLKEYRPSLKFVNFKKAFPLFNLGAKFFINQILYLIGTQLSIILVVQFFGPDEVTVYNLALRYISITSMGFVMILTPYLSAFTEAYIKKEYSWITRIMGNIHKMWLLISVLTLLMVFGSKIFFELWIGKNFPVPMSLIISLALTSIVTNYTASYSLFLNGIGKVNLQLLSLTAQALLFFPLSWWFYKMNMGLISVILPQFLFYFASCFLMRIQYKKILSQTATGIWAK